jgi:hypothetical protein
MGSSYPNLFSLSESELLGVWGGVVLRERWKCFALKENELFFVKCKVKEKVNKKEIFDVYNIILSWDWDFYA